MPELTDRQLELFTNYARTTVQNNQEIHPSDMPPLITMLQLLADRGFWVSGEQMEHVCDSLRSLGNRDTRTSQALRDYLRHIASGFEFQIRHRGEGQRWGRSYRSIAEDIISEQDVEYSNT